MRNSLEVLGLWNPAAIPNEVLESAPDEIDGFEYNVVKFTGRNPDTERDFVDLITGTELDSVVRQDGVVEILQVIPEEYQNGYGDHTNVTASIDYTNPYDYYDNDKMIVEDTEQGPILKKVLIDQQNGQQ